MTTQHTFFRTHTRILTAEAALPQTLAYIVATFGFLLPLRRVVTVSELKTLICQTYDQTNPRIACVVDYLNSLEV